LQAAREGERQKLRQAVTAATAGTARAWRLALAGLLVAGLGWLLFLVALLCLVLRR
jgi:hypothetical protein